MSLRKNSIIYILFSLFFLMCTKKDYEGPSINTLYGEFEVLETLIVGNKNPDFGDNEKVRFYCKLNKDIQWKIRIKGLLSNSVKEINGFSSTIDSNLTFWNGNTSQIPFFKEENCAIELTFLNESDTLRDSVVIASTKVYDGVLVADFENGLPTNSIVFNQSSMNMTFYTASDDALVGNSYFKMGGRMGWNEWLLGQLDIPVDFSSVNTSADNFYLNFGILSGINGELATDQFVNVLISESNAPFNGNPSNNGADVFLDTMEVYKYQIRPVDWVGWNMISVSYDQFEVKSSGGNNIPEPQNITAIRIQCQSCPSASGNCPENANVDVRTDIDYLIFTENATILEQ